jgi:hypothetical protein
VNRKENLAILGLGGLGLLLGGVGIVLADEQLRESARLLISSLATRLRRAPEKLNEWNDAAQLQLASIQETLQKVQSSLESLDSIQEAH